MRPYTLTIDVFMKNLLLQIAWKRLSDSSRRFWREKGEGEREEEREREKERERGRERVRDQSTCTHMCDEE